MNYNIFGTYPLNAHKIFFNFHPYFSYRRRKWCTYAY